MQEKENILDILKKTEIALKEDNPIVIRELSNKTIHTASIYQDPDNIVVAVLVYSLSKIIERRNYREYPDWSNFIKIVLLCISRLISAVEKEDEKSFRSEIKHIRKQVNKLSGNFKKQIQDVFRRAEVNKASRVYEHGISMQRTSELLGVSIWELADYAGKTGISDVKLNITLPESERIKNTLQIFEK